MLSQDNLEHVKLDSAFHVNLFAVAGAKRFRAQCRLLDLAYSILESTEFSVLGFVEESRSLNDVWHVKVNHVVASDDIWVDLKHEIPPSSQHCYLSLVAEDLATYDRCACIQSEDIALK